MFLVRVAVVALIGNSDHSSLSAVIWMAQAVLNLFVSRKVFLKHQVNWNTVSCAIRELCVRNIWLADNPVEVWIKHLLMLVGRYVPTKVIMCAQQLMSPGRLNKSSCNACIFINT